MTYERWGTFSVIDHKDTASLIPEVLLYDHLVFPVPPVGDEHGIQRWRDNSWDPDSLFKRLECLKDIAIQVPWDLRRQEIFHHKKMEYMNAVKFDAKNSLFAVQQAKQNRGEINWKFTRLILAEDQKINLSGDEDIDVVAAYQSEQDFKSDFIVEEPVPNEKPNLGLC